MPLKRRIHVKPEFSLAAMIDVIFLLLMFFMLTSKFVTPNALNLSLPSSSATTMASPTLSVSIRNTGEFYIETRKTPLSSLLPALQAKIRAMGKDVKSSTITVVAERGTPVEAVVAVLDVANKLQVKTILATDPLVEK